MELRVAHSHVKDGSMLNRADFGDEAVIANRKAWLETCGIDAHETYRVCLMFEGEDYCRYREVSAEDRPVDTDDSGNAVTDALITTNPHEALFLPIADCAGVVLFDQTNGVLMLTHLGRHSLEQNGAARSVEYLAEKYGSNPEELTAWVSAAVGEETYKIFKLDNKGLKHALFEQLAAAGVQAEHITDTPADTATHPDYYSHSEFLKGRNEKLGRHAVVAMMTES